MCGVKTQRRCAAGETQRRSRVDCELHAGETQRRSRVKKKQQKFEEEDDEERRRRSI